MHKALFVTLSEAKGLVIVGKSEILHCVQNDKLGCISIRATGSKPSDVYYLKTVLRVSAGIGDAFVDDVFIQKPFHLPELVSLIRRAHKR